MINQIDSGTPTSRRFAKCPSSITAGQPVLIGGIPAVALDFYSSLTGGTIFLLAGSFSLTVRAASGLSPFVGAAVKPGDPLYADGGTLDAVTNVTYGFTLDVNDTTGVFFGRLDPENAALASGVTAVATLIVPFGGAPPSGGGGSSLTLETDGVPNGSQTLLNLAAGANMTLTDDGSGTVTFDAAAGSSGPAFNSQTDETASRSLGVDYHNNTAEPIAVNLSMDFSGFTSFSVYSDDTPTPSQQILTVSDAGITAAVLFIVLPGNYYRVDGSGVTIALWIETTKV